jgi:hypothetical protein
MGVFWKQAKLNSVMSEMNSYSDCQRAVHKADYYQV